MPQSYRDVPEWGGARAPGAFLLFLMLTAGCYGRSGVTAAQLLQEQGRGDPLPRMPVQNFKFSIAEAMV